MYNSSKQERHIFDTITKDYTVLGEEGQQSESDGALSGRIDLKVSVLRKVSTDAAMSAASPWFPKKVVIVTKKRRIESMAWAHSSGDLINSCSSSSEMSCPIEGDSRSDLTMDSDPSLSSINSPSWYTSQSSSLPSTSSASTATSFQLGSITMEPDLDAGSMRSNSPPLDPANNEESEKELERDTKFGIEVRRFHIPLKVYPRNTRHQQSSTSEPRGYPCFVEGCGSILRTRTALRKHGKVHAERNFSCERCGRTFAEKTKLNRHMLTHTGERSFRCQFDGCSKAFSLEANLKSHIKTHTGEKPHKCQICDHAFSHPYNLRVHISRRHKEQSLV